MNYLKAWTRLCFYVENQTWGCLPSPNSGTVSTAPALLLINPLRQLPHIYPLQPLCAFSNFISYLQRPGTRPRLILLRIAITSSCSPMLLLFAFSPSLNKSILVLVHAEWFHQLLWNLGNRRYAVSSGPSYHSRLIKAEANMVDLSLGKSFAYCEGINFFLVSLYLYSQQMIWDLTQNRYLRNISMNSSLRWYE